MPLHDTFGVDMAIIVASAAGATSKLIIDRSVAPARAISGVVVGLFFGIYFTPLVTINRWWDLKADSQLPVAFALGLIGTVVVEKFLKWTQGLDLGAMLFERMFGVTKHKPDEPEAKK